MTITVDAVPLLMRSAGVKGYLYHWIRAMRAIAGGDSIRTYPNLRDLGELNHEGSPLGGLRTPALLTALAIAQRLQLPVATSRGSDIFHCSNQVRRPPRRCRLTATIHDLTCWTMPELHTSANVRADYEFARRVLCRADAIIAVSESTRRDAIRYLSIKPGKIVTIHSGVSDAFFDVPEAAAAGVAGKYGLAKPFALSVGTIEPRKNFDRLLDAWELLPASIRESHELVICGPHGWASRTTAARIGQVKGVRSLGYVPEADLPGLTRAATLLVYPSLYEGFGFPVAQAMAARTPVVASNISSLPEVTAGAAILIDPFSPTGIASGLRTLFESPSTRSGLAAKALLVAQRYRWERCARESLDFFGSLL